MCTTIPTHVPLNTRATVSDEVKDVIVFTVGLAADNGEVLLTLQQQDLKVPDIIAIERDSIVEVRLEGRQIFFSKQFDAVTFKSDQRSLYGGIEYLDYDEKLDRYRRARFTARFNRGGKFDTRHGFNINLDLLQRGKDRKNVRFVPLTVDPDITNPPPRMHNFR
ncbi:MULTISPECIES: nucleotide synthetase [unclassified Sphingomonas]|nr:MULTISPECIES: nucleotide synthetase [unclassified Sphingomonas]